MEKPLAYRAFFHDEEISEEPSASEEFFRTTNERLAQQEQTGILFQHEFSSLRERMSKIEKMSGSLKITRPHVETVANEQEALFAQLQKSIKNLLSNFEDSFARLSSFMELKAALADLNKGARKWGDVYLLRSIVVFYASIRHAHAEDIDKKQRDIIKEVGDTITRETIGGRWGGSASPWGGFSWGVDGRVDRNKYREIYKKLRSAGFRIIPEPSPAQDDE